MVVTRTARLMRRALVWGNEGVLKLMVVMEDRNMPRPPTVPLTRPQLTGLTYTLTQTVLASMSLGPEHTSHSQVATGTGKEVHGDAKISLRGVLPASCRVCPSEGRRKLNNRSQGAKKNCFRSP